MTEKVYGLHAVRALLTRHAERVTGVTIAEGREPRVADIQTLAQKVGKGAAAAPAVPNSCSVTLFRGSTRMYCRSSPGTRRNW